MPWVLSCSCFAVLAAVVPFLCAARSRAWPGSPCRPAHGRDAAHRWRRSRAPLDAAPPGRLGPRAVRVGALPRDDPDSPASAQAVVEEGQEAARPGLPGAAAGLY